MNFTVRHNNEPDGYYQCQADGGEVVELEVVNKLYLELSQIATAKTARELEIETLLQSAYAIADQRGTEVDVRRWNFARYRNGRKMAEGVAVHADDIGIATKLAIELNDDPAEKLVFVGSSEPKPSLVRMTNEEILKEAERIYPEDAQSLLAFFRGAEWCRDRPLSLEPQAMAEGVQWKRAYDPATQVAAWDRQH